MLYLFDQIISWALVISMWWVLHQTHSPTFTLPTLLMRTGLAAYTLGQVYLNLLRIIYETQPFLAGTYLKTSLFIMFVGIIGFHIKRFNKL